MITASQRRAQYAVDDNSGVQRPAGRRDGLRRRFAAKRDRRGGRRRLRSTGATVLNPSVLLRNITDSCATPQGLSSAIRALCRLAFRGCLARGYWAKRPRPRHDDRWRAVLCRSSAGNTGENRVKTV